MSAIVYYDDMIQCSVHPPSAFLAMHQHDLLPSWTQSVGSVVIVLQKCSISLAQCSQQTQRCKNELRDRFFRIGWHLVDTLDSPHDRLEIFDPRTGLPVRSPHGLLKLDDVAVACSSLGYGAKKRGACATLIHPTWGDAVYPATLISTAPVETVTQQLSHRLFTRQIFESQSGQHKQQYTQQVSLTHGSSYSLISPYR